MLHQAVHRYPLLDATALIETDPTSVIMIQSHHSELNGAACPYIERYLKQAISLLRSVRKSRLVRPWVYRRTKDAPDDRKIAEA